MTYISKEGALPFEDMIKAGDDSLTFEELKTAWNNFYDNRKDYPLAYVQYAREHFNDLFNDRYEMNFIDE